MAPEPSKINSGARKKESNDILLSLILEKF